MVFIDGSIKMGGKNHQWLHFSFDGQFLTAQ